MSTSIYVFSKRDLGILQKYIKKNLRKRFIKKFQLKKRYLILFIPKKNEQFPYILIIKNQIIL